MARKPAGKPLTFRPLRLDDDVWAAILKFKETHKTINEGLRAVLVRSDNRGVQGLCKRKA